MCILYPLILSFLLFCVLAFQVFLYGMQFIYNFLLYALQGFGMVKEALGDYAFYEKGKPQSFMTDNCDAERNLAYFPAIPLYISHTTTSMALAP